MNTLQIVKIGGNIVNNKDQLNAFLEEFAELTPPKILVHGGGSFCVIRWVSRSK